MQHIIKHKENISKACKYGQVCGGFLWKFKTDVLDEEIKKWKSPENFSKYLVSKDGRIYSKKIKKLLKTKPNSMGYFKRSLIDDKNHQQGVSIHRLVAECYVVNPDPEHYDIVNHIDGNPSNNHYTNLEWCTKEMNTSHAVDNGLITGKTVLQYKDGGLVGEFKNLRQAAKAGGISRSMVSLLCLKGGVSKGYSYKYK